MTDQNIVKIEINGKFYPISCKIGEEDRVIASGKLLSDIIGTLDNHENKISESNPSPSRCSSKRTRTESLAR